VHRAEPLQPSEFYRMLTEETEQTVEGRAADQRERSPDEHAADAAERASTAHVRGVIDAVATTAVKRCVVPDMTTHLFD
jgi:hypothetical protein